jgi:molybdate transport system permease protein
MIAVALVFTLFFAVPLFALVWRAVEQERIVDFLTDDVVRDALRLSLTTSLITLAVAVVLGTPVAFLLARWRFRGWRMIETLLDLPIILPPVVAGVALLMAFGRRGLLGSELDMLGIRLPFTTIGVIVAQLFVASPFYIRSAKAGFASIDRDIEAAAEIDGASTWRLLRDVSVPAALPAIGAGAVLCWARALSDGPRQCRWRS